MSRRSETPEDTDHWLSTRGMSRELGQSTVRAGRYVALANGGILLIEFGSLLALARLLQPADFGVFGMVAAITALLHLLRDPGLSMATIQRPELSQRDVNGLFWLNSLIGAGLTALVLICAPLVALLYRRPELVYVTAAIAPVFAVGAFGVQHRALLTRQLRFKGIAITEFVAALTGASVAISLGLKGYGYWALFLRAIVGPVVLTVGFWLACSWRPSRPSISDVRSDLAWFGARLTGYNLLNYLTRNLDDILIARSFGDSALGAYREAYRVLMMPLKAISNPIGTVMLSTLSRLHNEPERYRSVFLRVARALTLVSMPFAALAVALPHVVVEAVLGDQWEEAVPILRWFGLLMFTQPLCHSTGWLFISQDRTREFLQWGVASSVVTVVAFLVGLSFGVTGVAAAFALATLVILVPALILFVGRSGPVSHADLVRCSLPPCAAGAVAALVLKGAQAAFETSSSLAALVIALVLGLGVLVVVLLPTKSGREMLSDLFFLAKQVRSRGEGGSPEAGSDGATA